MIKKILIRNYRIFREFELELNAGMNILVGSNDAGKSTLLEAINLALTSRLGGKVLAYDLSPYLFNIQATTEYITALRAGEAVAPPEIVIDLFLNATVDTALLRGTNNLAGEDAVGVRIRAALNPDFADEYAAFVAEPQSVSLVPTEYYSVEWLGFSGNGITARSLPATASLIDATSIRLQSGADFYLQGIISNHLEKSERVELSRSYRSLRQTFSDNQSVKDINSKLNGEKGDVSDRALSLSIDISQRFTWESSLVPHLDDLPFQFVGNGEQNTLKILLALNRKIEDAHIVLIEEPENHLSFSSLNVLIKKIADKCEERQVIITTHSSYVLNKLGLDSLILLNGDLATRVEALPNSTEDYFKKLSGYDTLRVVLASRVILVEGPSDELVIQRAYLDAHGRLPIEDGVDVINVRGLSFKRFLDIARLLKRTVAVVTDNDGKAHAAVEASYSDYTVETCIAVHVGKGDPVSLEPQILEANSRDTLNALFGTDHATDDLLLNYMKGNKTACALAILEAEVAMAIVMPEYIQDAVA